MEVSLGTQGSLVFNRLDPFLTEILRQIPDAANPAGDANALARLSPPPIVGEVDDEFLQDWEDYVKPELQALFSEALSVVSQDLLGLMNQPTNARNRLEIPLEHADAWINALNQARIVLAERHHFTEDELGKCGILCFESRRDLALVQMNFYAMIQEMLIRWISDDLEDLELEES